MSHFTELLYVYSIYWYIFTPFIDRFFFFQQAAFCVSQASVPIVCVCVWMYLPEWACVFSFKGYFPQKSPIIDSSFAKNDLQLRHPMGLRLHEWACVCAKRCVSIHRIVVYLLHLLIRISFPPSLELKFFPLTYRIEPKIQITGFRIPGWRRPIGCLSCRSFFAKELSIIGLFCGK